MVGKKMFVVGLVVLMLYVMGCSSQGAEGIVRIGITQIVEHPALDAAREGFIAGLAQEGFVQGENVEFDIRSAQGEVANTQIIADNFVSRKKDMILAISTPSAQAAFRATKDIPIMITAVTDPLQAGIIEDWEASGTNVTGTSDRAPIVKQFE